MTEVAIWILMLVNPLPNGFEHTRAFHHDFKTSSKCEEAKREYVAKAKAASVKDPKAFCMRVKPS